MNTTDIVIILILIVILIPAVLETLKHLRGDGDCCGGPKQRPRRKKISGKPIGEVRLIIDGMHCDSCRVRVQNRLNELDGVVAKVDLENKTAKIKIYREIDKNCLVKAIEEAGYFVLE